MQVRSGIPPTERACADRLAAIRWPDGLTCTCGSRTHYRIQKRPRVFACQRCPKQTSVTADTVLHGCRKLVNWFRAASLIARDGGVSAAELRRVTGVHAETAWQMLHRLRVAMGTAGEWPITGSHHWLWIGCQRPLVRHSGTIATVAATVLPDGATRFRYVPFPALANTTRAAVLNRDRTDPAPPAQAALFDVRHQIRHTHQSVSQVWLPRYLRECQFRRNILRFEADRVARMMQAVLRYPSRSFCLLCPLVWPPAPPFTMPDMDFTADGVGDQSFMLFS